jgi:hypothetical protein
VINLDHVSVPARGSGMHHAAGGRAVDFGSISLSKVNAGMQGKTAKEWVGTIAKGRGDAGIAGKRHAQGHEGHERLEALGCRNVTRGAHERWVERGRVRIKVDRDIRAADAAFALRQREPRWIEPGLGDDRCIARGGACSCTVDGAESLCLVGLYPVEERSTSPRLADGSRLSGVLATLAVVNGAFEGRAPKVSPDSSMG